MRRFLALLRKEFLQIRRDPGSLRLMFVLPVLQTLVLGYAMTRDVRNVAVAIVDQDRTPESASLARRVRHNARFRDAGDLPNPEAAREALTTGSVAAALVLPRGFARDLERAQRDGEPPVEPVRVQLLLDGQDAASAGTVAGYASAIVSQWATETVGTDMAAQGFDASSMAPLETRERILFNPELDYAWGMVPGMVILMMTMTGALLTAFSIVRERENGTLEQLMVTPVRPVQVLLGKAVPYWLMGHVVFGIAFVASALWFGIPLASLHPFALLGALSLYCLASVSLGVLVSCVVGSQQQALFLIWFFMIFFILTSGFMLPFESMPRWMQHLTEINAVRHFLYMTRAFVLRGAGASELLPEYGKLAAIGIGLMGTATVAFRRKAS